ncbi:MAG: EamA family transporter [Rhodanobacteraceae bacterium]
MRRFYLIGFGLLMGFDTLAQISFKWAGLHAGAITLNVPWLLRIFTAPWIYGAVLGYVGAFFCWITLLTRAPVGPAFAASHLEVVAVLALSPILFGEHLSALQWLGSAGIIAGIACLAVGEAKVNQGES